MAKPPVNGLNPESLKNLLRQRSHEISKNDPKLTKEEVDRLASMMEHEEFARLFADYMTELSDPKNRAEQELYLRQLEEQNEVPHGKLVLRPEPGFVLKFKFNRKEAANRSGNGRSSKKKNKPTKLFINVVYSDKIRKPTSTEMKDPTNNASGTYWTLPYSLGPLRMEKDANKVLVPTFDCCFHPETLAHGAKNPAFRDLIVKTAREGAMQQYKNMGNPVEIEKTHRILKGVKYKDGCPIAMLITTTDCSPDTSSLPSQPSKDGDTSVQNPEGGTSETSQSPSTKSNVTKTKDRSTPTGKNVLQKGFLNLKNNTSIGMRSENDLPDKSIPNDKNVLKKGFLQNARSKPSAQANDENDQNDEGFLLSARKTSRKGTRSQKGGGRTEDGKVIPFFEVIEQGQFQLLDHTIDGLKRPSTRPECLEYRITLPQVKSAKCVELDVSEERLVLASVPGSNSSYHLDVKIPYPVLSNEGTAKFDKATSSLIVTLSVLRPEPQAPWAPTSSDTNLPNDENAIKDAKDARNIENVPDSNINNITPVMKRNNDLQDSPVLVERPKSHGRWLQPEEYISVRKSYACDEEVMIVRNERKDEVDTPFSVTDKSQVEGEKDLEQYVMVQAPAEIVRAVELPEDDCYRNNNPDENGTAAIDTEPHSMMEMVFELD